MPRLSDQQPKRPIRLTVRRTVAELIVSTAAGVVWGWCRELLALAVLAAGYGYATARLGAPAGHLVVAGALAVLLAVPTCRRGLAGWLRGGWVRRRWGRACRRADLATPNDKVSRIRRLIRVPAGDRLRLRLPAGLDYPQMQRQADRLAVALHAAEVRLDRDRRDASTLTATVVRWDPLATPAPPWPHLGAAELSVWAPIPVGVDEDGLPVTIRLPEHHVLLGGESGSGKSTALQQILATVALDPTAELWAVDGKELELACWEGAAHRSVGANVGDAIDTLAELHDEVTRRIGYLKRLSRDQHLPRRKVGPGDGLPLVVLVIDELACFLLLAEDADDRRRFKGLLLDLLNRARAVGIVVVAATQKPSGAVIPTEIRDGFGIRWAFRTTTRDASDTILGAGWAAQGYSSATLDAAVRGAGLLLAEGQVPVRLRAHEITDVQLADLAARAVALRARTPTVSLAVGATVPLPRSTDPASDDGASLSDDADGYLSDDELSAEWAEFVRASRADHPPSGAGGGPPT